MKLAGGGLEYQGGETRLIAIPNFCSFADLSESLERLAGSVTGMSSASTEQVTGPKLACHASYGVAERQSQPTSHIHAADTTHFLCCAVKSYIVN